MGGERVAQEREHHDAQVARMEALWDAAEETLELMCEHGMETTGEFAELGIALPLAEVAKRLLRAYEEGEMSEDDLRKLGVAVPGSPEVGRRHVPWGGLVQYQAWLADRGRRGALS